MNRRWTIELVTTKEKEIEELEFKEILESIWILMQPDFRQPIKNSSANPDLTPKAVRGSLSKECIT